MFQMSHGLGGCREGQVGGYKAEWEGACPLTELSLAVVTLVLSSAREKYGPHAVLAG